MERVDLQGFTKNELKKFAADAGEKPFRGKQLFKWIQRGARSFDIMTDLSQTTRDKFSQLAYIGGVDAAEVQSDSHDGTKKFLFSLHDGNAVEGVFMKYRYGNSLCVSSQVGCRK